MAKAKDVTGKKYICARIVHAWPFYSIAILRKAVQHLSGIDIPQVLIIYPSFRYRFIDTSVRPYD